ncbi:T9SS type A sorting domain-containing protein [Flavobacterium sp. LS1R49]|uniref:T9SS type A sorting domain-containing protein n=1 Tax=Flavobacterium shii TaxID=2987687 RepID=A0A9X2YT89_9FLAO|nr:choice-of-anchor tandem repeat GloVer-containing protein [Flavobacterium shii]MCV9926269.1 T9SS type A sorting domain-containing protein [Flavobacterium shii]
MMKQKLLLIYCLFSLTYASAQKEYWGLINGTTAATTLYGNGSIFKTDQNGANPQPVYNFDSTNGMKPYGRLFVASNGKLYGTASQGGYNIPQTDNTGGVLFEYDLTINRFKVVTSFGNTQLPTMKNPQSGIIEPINGTLYGVASGVGIFKYNMLNEITTVGSLVVNPYNGMNAFPNRITGELIRASDGNLYGTTQYYSSCPTLTPLLGSIIRFNPSNNSFSYIYPFNCTYYDGAGPTGSLVQTASGKLYGTTMRGGDYGYENNSIGDGTLFEYNIATNTFTKKISFNGNTTGSLPGPLTAGPNNKLYGVLTGKGKNQENPEQEVKGSLYEYDLTTGNITVLHYFAKIGNAYPTGLTPALNSLLLSSDGNLYGINGHGVFKFNPITNEVTLTGMTSIDYFYPSDSSDLIEICRKPTYEYFDADTHTSNIGESFTFDIKNTNATSYIWKKNGVVLPAQTTGILNLTAMTISDSGDYTCEMLNECGTTTTMPLHLTVEENLGLEEVIGTKNSITLYPNPVTNILNLCMPENKNFEVQNLTIWNALGQRMYSDTQKYEQIDVSGFSPGIYHVQLHTNKGSWENKFIKN